MLSYSLNLYLGALPRICCDAKKVPGLPTLSPVQESGIGGGWVGGCMGRWLRVMVVVMALVAIMDGSHG